MNEELIKEVVFKHSSKVMAPFDMLIERIGYDSICAITDFFGGSTLYIPTKKRMFGACFAEEMKKEFDGGNFKVLAKKYDVCERTVRYILSECNSLKRT